MNGSARGHLRAAPQRWWSSVYDVDGSVTATMDFGTLREDGRIAVGDETYRIAREGAWVVRPDARPDAEPLVSADKPSAWQDTVHTVAGDRNVTLRRPSIWRSRFELWEGDSRVGEVTGSDWSSTVEADVPAGLDDLAALTVLWTAVLLQRRHMMMALVPVFVAVIVSTS